MARKIKVNGKFTTLPGVYATFKSGIKNPSVVLPYGNVVIIDDGIGANYGGGSGVAGSNVSGKDAVYDFFTIDQMQGFVKGGPLWHIAEALFRPSKDLTIPGASKVSLIRACATAPASLDFVLTNGTLSFDTIDEGINANGALTSTNLSAGYGAKLIVAPSDSTKYIMQVWHSSYKGIDSLNNIPYDGIAAATATPQLVYESDPVSSLGELYTLLAADSDFLTGFKNLVNTSQALVAVKNAAGTGYAVNDTFSIAGGTGGTGKVTALVTGTGTGLTVNTTAVSGALTAAAVNAGGTGYAVNDVVTVAGGTGGKLTVTTVAGGVVTGLSVLVAGTGYTTATAAATVEALSSKVSTIQILTSGTGYAITTGAATTATIGTGTGLTINITSITGDAIVVGDVTSSYLLATGGTETYNTTHFDSALTAVKDLDNTYFLPVNSDNQSANNFKIFDFIVTESKYIKFMLVNGGNGSSDFASNSIDTAEFYNSERVVVVHGQFKRSQRASKRIYSTLYKTAMVLGRACGLPPQDALTFKDLWIDEEVHKLTETGPQSELEQANAAGVLVTYNDIDLGYVVVELDVNTLQDNENIINDDGTSYQHSIGRIKASLDRDVKINAKKRFFSKNTGPNRATLAPEDVKQWLQGFLTERCPQAKNPDSLILTFQNIIVTVSGDTISISFEFQPNFEVNKMVITAIIVDPNS